MAIPLAVHDGDLAQADIRLNGGSWGELAFFYADPDNYCAARIDDNDIVSLIQVVRGQESVLATGHYTQATSVTVKVAAAGDTATIWVAGTQLISDTLTGVIGGTVALAGEQAIFDNVKVGYDNTSDDDIDDAGDALVVNETFDGTDITPTHDDYGNLTFDGTYHYGYDAPALDKAAYAS